MPSFLRVRTVYEGWARYLVATVKLADGQEIEREIEDHGRAVCVLPYDPGRRLALLVRLFRAAAHFAGGPEEMFEAPAGLLEEDDPEDGARREVLEETGVRLRDLEPVATVWTMPGISTERMSLYLAAYAAGDRVAAGGGGADEHQGITLGEMPLAELAALAARGALADLKTLALVLALCQRRPDLFPT